MYYYVLMTDTYNILEIYTDKNRAYSSINKNVILLTLNHNFKVLFFEYRRIPYFYLKNIDIVSEECRKIIEK
jgi:hypothetical protein